MHKNSILKKRRQQQLKKRHDAVSKELFVALPQDRDVALLITWYTMQMEEKQRNLIKALHNNIHAAINWGNQLPSYVLELEINQLKRMKKFEMKLWKSIELYTNHKDIFRYYIKVQHVHKEVYYIIETVWPKPKLQKFETDELN